MSLAGGSGAAIPAMQFSNLPRPSEGTLSLKRLKLTLKFKHVPPPGNGPLVTDCKPGRISHQDPFPGTRPADEEIGGSSNQGRMIKN
jgi:hypothetical protein